MSVGSGLGVGSGVGIGVTGTGVTASITSIISGISVATGVEVTVVTSAAGSLLGTGCCAGVLQANTVSAVSNASIKTKMRVLCFMPLPLKFNIVYHTIPHR